MDEDQSLWILAKAGDERSFGEIFTKHRDRVFRALLRATALPSDAEDLTAVVFLELWRRRDAVRIVDGSILPWLLVTATNVGRNANRSRRRYTAFLAALPAPEATTDFAEAASQRLDAGNASSVIRDAIGSLGRVDATLIVLTAIEGYSIDEAAAAVGVTYSAAKTRLSRARQRLRTALPNHLASESR